MEIQQANLRAALRAQAASWWVTIAVSVGIVVGIIWFARLEALPILRGATHQWSPFVFALLGVALYVMASRTKRRERFDVRYFPDYCYRAAQAVVYLYVILAIVVQVGPQQEYPLTQWPPTLIGLLVGMFIEHVEKAMEGFGQRFEEVLAGFLPRSLVAKTSREKQLDRLRNEQRYATIKTQLELVASQGRDPGLRAAVPRRLGQVEQVIRDGDDKAIADEVDRLAWEFEEIKVAMREEEMNVAEVLSLLRRPSAAGGPDDVPEGGA